MNPHSRKTIPLTRNFSYLVYRVYLYINTLMLLWAHECHVYTLWNYNIYNAFTHCGHCVKPYCEPCVVFNPHCAGNNAPLGGGREGTMPHPPPRFQISSIQQIPAVNTNSFKPVSSITDKDKGWSKSDIFASLFA